MKHVTRTYAGALCVLALASSMAQSAAPAPGAKASAATAAPDREADRLARWLGALLELPASLPIDNELRVAAEAMAKAHMARMAPVFAKWIAEERARLGPSKHETYLAQHLDARYMNEVALWRLESPGADYDTALLPALLSPSRCPLTTGLPLFARQMVAVQQVPATQRAMVLAGERELLARWGTRRSAVPDRTVPSLAEQEDLAFARMLNEDWRPAVPMPPMVASHALRRQREPMGDFLACLTHQWWLQSLIAQEPQQRTTALTSWRYAHLPEAGRWLVSEDRLKGKTASDYPPFAAQYGIEGTVSVEVVLDARGRVSSTRVVSRSLTVSGLDDVRPIAFETALDDASIARVRLPDVASKFKPQDGKPQTTYRVPVGWSLQ